MKRLVFSIFQLFNSLDVRGLTALCSCGLLLQPSLSPAAVVRPKPDLPEAVFKPLQESLLLSYDELFRIAPTLEFTPNQIERMRNYVKDSKKYCVNLWEDRAKQREKELRDSQQELRRRTASLSDDERHRLHCRIQNSRILKNEAEMFAGQAVPTAYENRLAKLDVIEKWPGVMRDIRRQIQAGEHHGRRWG